MSENFPNLIKDTKYQNQKAQWIPIGTSWSNYWKSKIKRKIWKQNTTLYTVGKQYKWQLISNQKLQRPESNRNENEIEIENLSTQNSKSNKYPSEIAICWIVSPKKSWSPNPRHLRMTLSGTSVTADLLKMKS